MSQNFFSFVCLLLTNHLIEDTSNSMYAKRTDRFLRSKFLDSIATTIKKQFEILSSIVGSC